jgi:hypothetical protein
MDYGLAASTYRARFSHTVVHEFLAVEPAAKHRTAKCLAILNGSVSASPRSPADPS